MDRINKEQEIIKIIFKDFLTLYNSRSISKLIGLTHAGAFKILKKLEKRNIVKAKRIGNTVVYSLEMENPVTLREIEMILTIEAQNYRRWIEEFIDIKVKVKFVILFGSIIRNEKEAKDIDLLIVSENNKLKEIQKIINKKNELLNKKIHPLLQTPKDFKNDIKNKNKVMIEILKTGVVLFGQEEISKIIAELNE
ncbi:MAG: nucleotidyltransferase domain-containing protein [Nanoarchaeota archaeon]